MEDHSDDVSFFKKQQSKYAITTYRFIFGLMALELIVLAFSQYINKLGYPATSAFISGLVGMVIVGNLYLLNRKHRKDQKFYNSLSYIRLLNFIGEISEDTGISHLATLMSPRMFEAHMNEIRNNKGSTSAKRVARLYFRCKDLFYQVGNLDERSINVVYRCLP